MKKFIASLVLILFATICAYIVMPKWQYLYTPTNDKELGYKCNTITGRITLINFLDETHKNQGRSF